MVDPTGVIAVVKKFLIVDVESFAKYGWGTYKSAAGIKDFKAGDVMSSSTHVYIVVGSCQDGSVVLVHSSPAGVRLSGTPNRQGKAGSEAVRLAKAYMKKYYPSWYRRYPFFVFIIL